ncbi:MAG TPA: hypothetical protein VFQ40_04485, partial [Actinomycetota bacterium]|nr:hypothetical protein [Actinomycetota bacterium]
MALATVVLLAGGPAFADGIIDTATGDASDPITDVVNDTTDPVTDALNDTTDPVTDAVNDTTDPVTDAVNDTTDPVTDAVNDTTDPVTDAVSGSTGASVAGVTTDAGTGAATGATTDPNAGADVLRSLEGSTEAGGTWTAWSSSVTSDEAAGVALHRREGGVLPDAAGDDTGIVAGGAGLVVTSEAESTFCAVAPNVCVELTDVTRWLAVLFGVLEEGLLGLPLTGASLLGAIALALTMSLLGVAVLWRSG